MFRNWFKFSFEFPPETREVIAFGNRVLDFLETQDQKKVDSLTQLVEGITQVLQTSTNRLDKAIKENNSGSNVTQRSN